MNILRLSTLLLFTMTLIPLGVSAHCKNKHGPGHPHCEGGEPPDPGGNGEFTAALTMGGFIFSPEVVTPNSTGNSYYGEVLITMNRVDVVPPSIPPGQNLGWDTVFTDCMPLVSLSSHPYTFSVKGNNWHINGGAGSEI